jgi:hypothetical protein
VGKVKKIRRAEVNEGKSQPSNNFLLPEFHGIFFSTLDTIQEFLNFLCRESLGLIHHCGDACTRLVMLRLSEQRGQAARISSITSQTVEVGCFEPRSK